MRRLFLPLLCLLVPALLQAREAILDYDVRIEIQADARLEVTETLTVQAEGVDIRRGLTRDVPTIYRDRLGNRVITGLRVLGVERDGRPEPWFTESMSNGIRINTGNDDLLPVPAVYRYTLRYTLDRQIGFFETHDELYFNAIPQDAIFPIVEARVEVRLPQPVPVERMTAEAYTGPIGARGEDYVSVLPAPGVARWTATRPFAPREGMTVALSFPKGVLPEPTAVQRLVWLLSDNRSVLVALAGFIVLLVYCARRWQRVGRDPAKGVIIARYEPPAGFSPGGLRYLQRRRYHARCFSADILDMAVKGYLSIGRKKGLLSDTWTLVREGRGKSGTEQGGDGTDSLAKAQSRLLRRLFGHKDRITLDSSNATTLSGARETHSKELDARFHPRYFNRNASSLAWAVIITVATVVLAFLCYRGAGFLLTALLVLLMIITVVVFGWLVQAPTPEGRKLLDHVEGLKLYLGVAERDELKSLPGPEQPPPLDAERYQRLLPYAVALEVEDAWTKKFTLAAGAAAAAAATASMTWYHGGAVNDLSRFSRSVGTSLSSVIASASRPPGSSSGSGGGGFSGGGGGGGGVGGR